MTANDSMGMLNAFWLKAFVRSLGVLSGSIERERGVRLDVGLILDDEGEAALHPGSEASEDDANRLGNSAAIADQLCDVIFVDADRKGRAFAGHNCLDNDLAGMVHKRADDLK